jgi:hypothetical protein
MPIASHLSCESRILSNGAQDWDWAKRTVASTHNIEYSGPTSIGEDIIQVTRVLVEDAGGSSSTYKNMRLRTASVLRKLLVA